MLLIELASLSLTLATNNELDLSTSFVFHQLFCIKITAIANEL